MVRKQWEHPYLWMDLIKILQHLLTDSVDISSSTLDCYSTKGLRKDSYRYVTAAVDERKD